MVFGMGDNPPETGRFPAVCIDSKRRGKHEGTYGDLTYTKYDTYIEISKCDKNAETVEIPAEIDGLPVTTIGDSAFYDCTSLDLCHHP